MVKIGSILIIMALAAVLANTVHAKDKIVWPYVCFKPVYICEDNQLARGSGFHILNLLWQKMPEYEHELLKMPIKRIIESTKQGEHQLFYGMYKTPAREKSFHFSMPCRISTPTFLVVRKADLSKFGNGKQVSLHHFLANDKLTFLYLQSVSFGKGIDELLERYKNEPNVLTEHDTTNMIGKSLKLLLNSRIDYMLSMDGTRYDASKLGIADKIAFIPLVEQNRYDVGYIIAPKNEWGLAMIDRVNATLKKVIPTEAFFQYFTPLVEGVTIPILRKQFNEHILAPSNEYVYLTAIQEEQTHAMAKEILREAYRRIGYNVLFESFPGHRSLIMANNGESDGDVARIGKTEKAFPNLIPVPTPILWFKGVAFAKNVDREINEWNDLKGLRIGIIRGIRYSEIGTKGLSPFFAKDMTHLFKLLNQGRIQVAIAVLKAGELEISQNYKTSGIRKFGKALFSAPLFHYVHKKNSHLVPELNNSLQEMEKTGETVKIIDTYLLDVANRKPKQQENKTNDNQ